MVIEIPRIRISDDGDLRLCSSLVVAVAVGMAGGGVGVGKISLFESVCCFNFSISSRSVFAASSQIVLQPVEVYNVHS